MIVLGLETSCDETAAAVLDGERVLSNVVATQLVHAEFGGIVPEIASREHEKLIIPVVRQALAKAQVRLADLEGIAVTCGPGLSGALLVGLNFAKGLSSGLTIPFVGINHMEGHLYANFLNNPEAVNVYPVLCLLVSGGHTQIWRMDGVAAYRLIGRTLDDAVGEAFDKGARLLALGFPGGPAIQEAAVGGDTHAVEFPRPMTDSDSCDFSFSGLKTALYYYLRKQVDRLDVGDIAASYQAALVDCLINRLECAVKKTRINRVVVAGGVAANTRLRAQLDQLAQDSAVKISYPPLEFCTDNAAMIALAGVYRLQRGEISQLDLEVMPNLSLADIAVT